MSIGMKSIGTMVLVACLTLCTCNSFAADGDGSGGDTAQDSSADSAPPPPPTPPATSSTPPVEATKSPEIPAPVVPSHSPAGSPAKTIAPARHETAPAKPSPPGKPMVLTGRIEELCKGNATPTLPLKWKKMEPIRDTSLDQSKPLTASASSTKLTTGAQQQSYPMDFRGNWVGNLTIFQRTFAPIRWEFDKAEAEKEFRILTPGRMGQVQITFYQKPTGGVAMEPCQVIFTTTTTMSDASQSLGVSAQQLGAMANMQVPVMYALHLGNLTSGVGVTGNQLQSKLMKNDLKQLRSDVIEQQVVTHDSDRNPKTGTTRLSYSESVLRFTRVSSNQLYLQSASVNYRNDGKFCDKVIMYGTLNRSSGVAGPTAVPGLPNFPGMGGAGGGLGGGGFGGGGGGNMMDAVKQIQQMMQQMQR